MKECFKCFQEKELSEFYKHPQMPDGTVNKCKECNKADNIQNRNDKSDHYRAYDKKRAMIPHRVAARKEYDQTDAGKESNAKARDKYRESYPNAYRARMRFGNALRSGKIARPTTCSECPSTKMIQGHHDDYDKPLDVRWLCVKCHTAWHRHNTPLNRI